MKILKTKDKTCYLFNNNKQYNVCILKNNYINKIPLNNIEYIFVKSLIKNQNNDIKCNIKNKLKKLNLFNKKDNQKIISNINYIDKNKEYKKNMKNVIVSNIYENNQQGGFILWYISKTLNNVGNISNFLYYSYNWLIIIVDIILDILLILPRFNFLKKYKNHISIINLFFGILHLDYLSIISSILSFIPVFGDILGLIGGLTSNFYKFINIFNDNNEEDISDEDEDISDDNEDKDDDNEDDCSDCDNNIINMKKINKMIDSNKF